MPHVPRLDLLYPRARRRNFFSMGLLWFVLLGTCGALSAVMVRHYLQHAAGSGRALIAARQTALAQAGKLLSEIEHINVLRSADNAQELTVTGEGINAEGIRCRFEWRSSSGEPNGSLTIAPLVK